MHLVQNNHYKLSTSVRAYTYFYYLIRLLTGFHPAPYNAAISFSKGISVCYFSIIATILALRYKMFFINTDYTDPEYYS